MLETVAFTPEAIQNDMEFDTNTGAKVPKLAKPDDWLNWYPAIQSIGISKGVWQWATPDEPDSKIPPPPLIKPPSIEQFLTDQKKEDNAAKKEKEEKSEFFSSSATKEAESGSSHGIDINQLSQANQERYMNAWKLYRMAYQEYEGPMEYLASVIYNSKASLVDWRYADEALLNDSLQLPAAYQNIGALHMSS
ncbi:hypothetical protein CNMCM6106_009299 [Aspergillus hiratsukae]|uniref:Uncharacterized protein n=1 Tax=Aspergillus hiratsukae TaxID=1194566 RepID=A0A8H6QKP0_9EURO|nr:hypothetical protein CNMCM6106_009299 [Aspergillus hiratsukae]